MRLSPPDPERHLPCTTAKVVPASALPRVRFALLWAACLPACLPAPPPPAYGDPALAIRLPALARAFGATRARPAPRPPVLVRYAVTTHDGRWQRDIVLTGRAYAERRTRSDGVVYAFGEDAWGAWLRVGAAPARRADETWRAEARTQRGLFDLAFLSPRQRDDLAFLGAGPDGWELAFKPDGGSSLVFVMARASRPPDALDVHDHAGRLVACDSVRWARRAGRMLPASLRCATVDGAGQHAIESRFALVSAAPLASLPAWAAVPPRPAPPVLARPVELAQLDIRHPTLDLAAPTGARTRVVLDTGASLTVLDGDAARALGVVPTGEAPLAFEPPWLPDFTSWVGVADRLAIGPAVIDGARVLVSEGFADNFHP